MMTGIFAQGNLLLERVRDVSPSGTVSQNVERRCCRQKARPASHCHAIRERVRCFRDDSLPRER
jgi:hypothetical protein